MGIIQARMAIPGMYSIKVLDLTNSLTLPDIDMTPKYEELMGALLKRGKSITYGRNAPGYEKVDIHLDDSRFSRGVHGRITLRDLREDDLPGVIFQDMGKNKPRCEFYKQSPTDDPKMRNRMLIAGETTRVYPGESVDYFDMYGFVVGELSDKEI